jgi:hypothetical protein
MSYFTNTNEWIRKTKENMSEEQEYKNKLANNESISMFKTEKRARTGRRLIPKHDITRLDNTLYTFIEESSIMCTRLHDRITELEDKIQKLENKDST